MKIKLRENHLLIEVGVQDMSKKGIHLTPESVEAEARKATYGQVVEAGPKATIKIGEFVLYKQYVGNELKHSSLDSKKHYIVVAEDDILAIVPEDKEEDEKILTLN